MRSLALVLTVFLTSLGLGGCRPEGPEIDQASDALEEAAYDAWAVHGPDGAIEDAGFEIGEPAPGAKLSRAHRALGTNSAAIHPRLAATLESAAADTPLEVIIAARSIARLSSLPRYDRELDADDPYNLEIEYQRELLRRADGELRALERAPLVAAVEELGGRVIEQFRVGNALVVETSAGSLRALLEERAEIAAVSPVASDEAPAAYYIDDGRARQDSDPFEEAGYDGAGYRVGLLDTGLYAAHYVFNSPDPVYIHRDCWWTPNSDCSESGFFPWYLYYDAGDPAASGGHGTGMADILAGNSRLGDGYRGVAPGAHIDSTNVFSGTDHSALDQTAVLRAMNYLDLYDDVILANIAADENPGGTIALAADDLYDEGVIVVAPVGNESSDYAHSPAVAHKVLGIGAYYTSSGGDYCSQSGGTGSDGRLKPDVTAPTALYVASSAGARSTVYRSGTCPAAAFAAGAAVLLRDYYDYRGWSSDPGAVYAAMITFGDEGGADLDNIDGAGNLELGEVSSSSWLSGVRYVDSGEYEEISFYVASGSCDLRAGIWWAEDENDYHNKMYLYLYQGSSLKKYSTHSNSVFQKVLYPSSLGSGWWKLKIYGSVNNKYDGMKVHYLIHYRNDC